MLVTANLHCSLPLRSLSLRPLPPLCSNNDSHWCPYSLTSKRSNSQSQCQLPLNPAVGTSKVPLSQVKIVRFQQSQHYRPRHHHGPANRYMYGVMCAVCVLMCIGELTVGYRVTFRPQGFPCIFFSCKENARV
jgi:hypothetical protein